MKIAEHLEKKQARVIAMLGAACVAALIVLIIVAVQTAGAQEETTVKGQFTPPAFESAAVSGVPEVENEAEWAELNVRDGYVIKVCGVLRSDGDGNAKVWFCSDAGNEVWVKLRICDGEDYVIGETGILRPGEYVESVKLKKLPEPGSGVVMYVMAYEPETYYSAGTVTLSTTIEIQ